jgi:undecaprenol kinase
MIKPKQLVKSFRHALRGIYVVTKTEQSFRAQLFVAVLVLALGIFFHVTVLEWVVLLGLIAAVLSVELINSIFERIVDAFKPRIHPMVKDIKDMMAAGVLIVSIISAVIGLIIFCPYILELVRTLG